MSRMARAGSLSLRSKVGFVPLSSPSRSTLALAPLPYQNLPKLILCQRRRFSSNSTEEISHLDQGKAERASASSTSSSGLPSSSTLSTHRTLFDLLAKKLGFTSMEDWYRLRRPDIVQNMTQQLFLEYDGPPSTILQTVYPEHTFLPWKFRMLPKGYFDRRENRKRYVLWLKDKIGVSELNKLRVGHFIKNHGSTLINMYGRSVKAVLDSLDVESYNPKPTLSDSKQPLSPYYRPSLDEQLALMEELGSRIGASKSNMSPWYNIDAEFLVKSGLNGLLQRYGKSPYLLLKKIYSDHEWIPWKFKNLPNLVTRDPDIPSKALKYIETELKISKPELWYEVSVDKLRTIGMLSFVTQSGGLFNMLSQHRQDYPWEEHKFVGVRSFGWKSLGVYLRRLWPQFDIVEDFSLSFGGSTPLRVSYYIPSLKLAFQYQSARDYGVTSPSKPQVPLHLKVDPLLLTASEKEGLRLIYVSFWWDRSISSLIATILDLDRSLDLGMTGFDKEAVDKAKPIPQTYLTS